MTTATCEQCGLSGLDAECDLVCYACQGDAEERGYDTAIHDVKLVLAVIEAFEALRGSMGVCLECGTHTRCTASARHGFGVCHRCEARTT